MRIDIEAVGVRVDGHQILDDITMACASGRITGLTGPNGSGKTTLLKVLAGLLRPTSGRVLLGGESVHSLSRRVRARRLALVEQQATTGLDLTARDVVALGRVPHRSGWGGDQDGAEVVDRALAAVDACGYADRPWKTLSGGERQRVHLGRALAQEPRVLLLDEPTNHLDLAHQLRFLDRIRDVELTTVLAVHDLDLAAAYCDDLAVLKGGRLVRHGEVHEVLSPSLIADVHRVDADVEPHPHRSSPHVRWNSALEEDS